MRTGPSYVVDSINFTPTRLEVYYHSMKDDVLAGGRPTKVAVTYILYVDPLLVVDIINELQEDANEAIDVALEFEAANSSPPLETDDD